MDSKDDDDLRMLRSSAVLLPDIQKALPYLLHRKVNGSSDKVIRKTARERDLYLLFSLIEPFQEDPQLLDAHLKTFIPPLVDVYLETLRATTAKTKPKKGYMPLSHAICQLLNLFCKVRGEKVIKGFLNNEPRYLEPILSAFEKGENFQDAEGESLPSSILPWTERYILLLWLSHLMLAPFPLASMSSMQQSQETSTALGIDLPPELPEIAHRCLTICVNGLRAATKERGASANLLVRLCVRPDMQKLGLLESLVKWSLSFFSADREGSLDIHQDLGVLSFLSGLVTSATNEEIGPFLPAIYRTCQNVIQHESLQAVKSSAVARQLIIKTFRNIAVHCLQDSVSNELDTTVVIEEVIEFLLEVLADGDTPVRYAASKALSVITMKLDPEMAAEVVEAILGSLGENVYWQGAQRNLSGVDPLQWHGLTLTLSHLLYRRAVSTSQLPDILNALLLALAFEQRSATGGSIGTNVRDAACFGIWAISRRYATKELLEVQTSSVRASEHIRSLSILQVLAIELLVVACLDPAGNIRRGSSAALQELIGRHPDTVSEGIPLVQIVDFHAVGLRERAMCDVAIKGAGLQPMYWDALFTNLLGWRGTGSLDVASRLYAASAVGRLSEKQDRETVVSMAYRIWDQLKQLRPREVEERQGLIMSISALVNQVNSRQVRTDCATDEVDSDLMRVWELLNGPLQLDEASFVSPALRPEFTASAMCTFLGSMAAATCNRQGVTELNLPVSEIVRQLNLCLARHEDSVLQAIPGATRGVIELLSLKHMSEKDTLISDWLNKLENEASYNGLRCSGYAVALGAAYPLLNHQNTDDGFIFAATKEQLRMVKTLTFRCTSAVAIEARTVALQALDVLLRSYAASTSGNAPPLPEDVSNQIASALHIALNDYTVTERGDVGSLVRLEALTTIGTAWSVGLFKDSSAESIATDLHAAVLQLSTEKIDKIRQRASHVLSFGAHGAFERIANSVVDGVSSYEYFRTALMVLQPSTPDKLKDALCLGYASSAGMGSESVVQNARAALLDAIENDAVELLDVAGCLTRLLEKSLGEDRTLLPLLEVWAWLGDMGVLEKLVGTGFSFRKLLSLTQKAHFKSTHMQKLHLAIDVYRGLGNIQATRVDTITKLTSMLLHPFPKVRIAAAETLWILTREEGLKPHDWSLPSKTLKPSVEEIKKAVCL